MPPMVPRQRIGSPYTARHEIRSKLSSNRDSCRKPRLALKSTLLAKRERAIGGSIDWTCQPDPLSPLDLPPRKPTKIVGASFCGVGRGATLRRRCPLLTVNLSLRSTILATKQAIALQLLFVETEVFSVARHSRAIVRHSTLSAKEGGMPASIGLGRGPTRVTFGVGK